MIKIGILECDPGTDGLWQKFGKFPDMFAENFLAINPDLTFQTYDLYHHNFPTHINECDAFVITGSRFSVYDEKDWMIELETFIQKLDQAQKKCVGICYGHQIMAKAMGGKVKKSLKGWGVGIMTHQIYQSLSWMKPAKKTISTIVSHQDQVIEIPKNAKLIAGSDFCPNYWLSYGNHFTTLQGHPEFCKEFSKELMKKKETLAKKRRQEGIHSLKQNVDSALVNRWLVNFLNNGDK